MYTDPDHRTKLYELDANLKFDTKGLKYRVYLLHSVPWPNPSTIEITLGIMTIMLCDQGLNPPHT